MKRYRGSLSQISPPVSAPSLDFSSSDSAANLVAFLLFSIVRRVRRANVTANARSRQLGIVCKDIGDRIGSKDGRTLPIWHVLCGIYHLNQSIFAVRRYNGEVRFIVLN